MEIQKAIKRTLKASRLDEHSKELPFFLCSASSQKVWLRENICYPEKRKKSKGIFAIEVSIMIYRLRISKA